MLVKGLAGPSCPLTLNLSLYSSLVLLFGRLGMCVDFAWVLAVDCLPSCVGKYSNTAVSGVDSFGLAYVLRLALSWLPVCKMIRI